MGDVIPIPLMNLPRFKSIPLGYRFVLFMNKAFNKKSI